MLGMVLLLVTTIVSAWAATQFWDYPAWPRYLLSFIALIDAIAIVAVLLRQTWSRRMTMILMAIQFVVVDAVLVVAAAVLIRDNDPGAAFTLIPVLFVLPALANSAIAVLAARSIGKLAWLER